MSKRPTTTHTVVMFSIAPDRGRAYLYLHRQETPAGGGKRVKVKFHPLSLIQCDEETPRAVTEAVSSFVSSYGITNITIHRHQGFPELHLVEIHEGIPQNGEDVFNLICYHEAVIHFHDGDHLHGGIGHIEAIQEIIDQLMAEAGVAA